MKKSFFAGVTVAGFLFLLLTASCKKSAKPSANPITPLQQLLNTDTTLTSFHRLLLIANEAGLLADDSVTLLAPSNAAFRAAGFLVDSMGSTDADRLVRYAFLQGRVLPVAGDYTGYTSVLGYVVYGQRDNASGTWFNGSAVTGDTLQVGKALVYRMNMPIAAAYDSLGSLLAADSTLTFFAAALARTGLDSTLSAAASPYTFLAPVNSAFIAAGYDSLGSVDSADVGALTTLVKNQVLTGIAFRNTLAGVSSVTTLQGNSISVSQSGNILQFAGSGNPVPANLLSANRMAGNLLVVHRTDQVLR